MKLGEEYQKSKKINGKYFVFTIFTRICIAVIRTDRHDILRIKNARDLKTIR